MLICHDYTTLGSDNASYRLIRLFLKIKPLKSLELILGSRLYNIKLYNMYPLSLFLFP